MAFDTFLKIDGLTDPESKGVEVFSFSWGLNEHQSTGAGHASGKVTISDLSVMKRTDSTSPKLIQACVTGKHFQKATLTAQRNNADGEGTVFYKLSMSQVLVSSVQHSGSAGGDDTPTESVNLNFQKFDIAITD